MKLKPCPCGNENVYLERKPLWNGNRGYVGCYKYKVVCDNPNCIWEAKLPNNDTIYHSDKEAKQNAIDAWNNRKLNKEG